MLHRFVEQPKVTVYMCGRHGRLKGPTCAECVANPPTLEGMMFVAAVALERPEGVRVV